MNRISATTTRVGIVSLCGVVLVAAFVTTTPKPWVLTAIGMGFGCAGGYLRCRAIDAGNTARAANALAWLSGIGLMLLAMAFAEDMFLGAWAASFAGYLLLDGLFSLSARHRKDPASSGAARCRAPRRRSP